MGIHIGPITPERSEELGVAPNRGVVVENVIDNSPAEQSGLKENDVILSFDGRPTRSVAELQEIVTTTLAKSLRK